jgi:hypothetical protein
VTKRAKRADKPNPRADRTYNRNPGYDAPQDGERFAPKKRRVDLIPRSLTQEKYIKAQEDEDQ